MNDNYSFEDKMRELLEEERGHRYKPVLWRRLSRRLETHHQPPTSWWTRWTPYAFALLIGLLAWQLWQQQVLRHSITELNNRLADQRQPTTTNDGNVSSQTVVVYDTIYQRTVVRATQSDQGAGHFLRGTPLFDVTSYRQPATFPRFTGGSVLDYPQQPTSFLSSAQNDFRNYRQAQLPGLSGKSVGTEAAAPYFITERITAPRIQFLSLPAIAFPTLPAPAAAPHSIPRVSVWRRLSPKSAIVSLGGGQFKSWAYGSDDGNPFVDLNLELSIGKSFSLDVGTAFLQRSFSTETEDDNLPTDLPTISPCNPNDELEEIQGRIQQLQFPIGIRYYPWQRGRFRAYLGTGLAPVLGLSSSFVRYEYEEDDEEYYTLDAPNVVSTKLRTGAVYGKFGVQAAFGNHLSVGLGGTVQQPLGTYTFDYQRPPWARWRLEVGYKFK